jgi:transposase
MALEFYYLENNASNKNANFWLNGSFSSILFPAAQLQSQRISELLAKLGDESVISNFFNKYLNMILPSSKNTGVLIDSTGLPNAIHFPLTAVNNHNGIISNEVRLIYVIDITTGLPLFFRYNSGNIVDIKTLIATLNELKRNGVSVKNAILDAGYCSEENVKKLYDSNINFLTRLPINRKIFINTINLYREEVLSDYHRYIYNDRIVGIKRVYTPLYGHRGYLYLCVDYNKRNDQLKQFTKKAIHKNIPRKKWSSCSNKMGFFAIISSTKIDPEDLLPLYYTRQTVEQIFDVSKTNIQITPLRTHNEETFRGHIMLSFISVIIFLKLNQCFKGHKVFNAQNALMAMRNLKCKVYDDCILVKEPTKDMREICKVVGIEIPEKINLPLTHQ